MQTVIEESLTFLSPHLYRNAKTDYEAVKGIKHSVTVRNIPNIVRWPDGKAGPDTIKPPEHISQRTGTYGQVPLRPQHHYPFLFSTDRRTW